MKKIISIILCLVMILSIFTTVSFTVNGEIVTTIPDDASYFNGNYYKVFDNKLTWTEANEYCENLGGHLVTITSEKENEFIVSLTNNSTRPYMWLGGLMENKKINWITGEKCIFINWADDQPDNYANDEPYLMLYTRRNKSNIGKWNDENNTIGDGSPLNAGFICEWDNLNESSIKNLETDPNTNTSSSFSNLDFTLQKDIKFNVPENIPVLGGHEISIDLSFVPIATKIDGNKLYIGLGVNEKIFKSLDRNQWNSWKNYVSKYSDDIDKGKELYNVSKGSAYVSNLGFVPSCKTRFYGYVELTKSNNVVKVTGSQCNLLLEGKGSCEWQAVTFIPIVFKLSASVGVNDTVTLNLNDNKKNVLTISNDMDITLFDITGSAGVGVAHIADISAYGNAKDVLSFKIKNQKSRMINTLYGDIGLSVKALFYEDKLSVFKNKNGIVLFDSDKYKSSSLAKSGFNDFYDINNYKINRSYISNQSNWNSSLTRNKLKIASTGYNNIPLVLQSSVYTNAKPQIIKTNEETIMIFTSDDGTRTTGNHTMLFYSLFDEKSNTWSEPKIVDDDGTADFYPQIASDGENTYLVWSNANKKFDEDVTPYEIAKSLEIKVAKFNIDTSSFDEIKQITDNQLVDINPKINIINGSPVILFKESDTQDILSVSNNDKLVLSTINENDEFIFNTVLCNGHGIYEYALGDNEFAFLQNINDVYDIYTSDFSGNSKRITDDSLEESFIEYNTINGEKYLTYVTDGTLYRVSNHSPITKITDESIVINNSYYFADVDNETELFYLNNENNATNIMLCSQNKEGIYCSPLQITSSTSNILSPSFVIYNDDILLVYQENKISYDELYDFTETASIISQVITKGHDLQISNTEFDASQFELGKDATISVEVINKGLNAENNYEIMLFDSFDNCINKVTYTNNIKPGEKVSNLFISNIPNNINSEDYYLKVITSGGIKSEKFPIHLLRSQLSVSAFVSLCDDSERGLAIEISNRSKIDSNVSLILKSNNKDGEILDTISIGNIKANTSKTLFYGFNEYIQKYRMLASSLYIYVKSDDFYEESTADNYTTINLLDSLFEFSKGDANGDQIVSVSDVTAIQQCLAHIIREDQININAAIITGNTLGINDATTIQLYLVNLIDAL